MLSKNLTSYEWEKVRKEFTTEKLLQTLQKDLSNLRLIDSNSAEDEKHSKFYAFAPTGLIFAIGAYIFEDSEEIHHVAFDIFDTIFTDYSSTVRSIFTSDKHTKKYAKYYEALRILRMVNWIERLNVFCNDKRYEPFTHDALMPKYYYEMDQSERVLKYLSNPEIASRFNNKEIAELLLIVSNISIVIRGLITAKIITELTSDTIHNKDMEAYSERMFCHILDKRIDDVERIDACINVENPLVTAFCLYLKNSPDISDMENLRLRHILILEQNKNG